MEDGKGRTKSAWENILSCHQRCVPATVAAATIIATLMILHLSVCQLVPQSPPSPHATCRESKSFLPSLSMRLTPANVVTIIYALVMTDNKALKNTNRSRQLRPRARTRVGTRSQNLNPNLIPMRVATVFCQLVRLMCNEVPCVYVCVSVCVLKGLCVCALSARSP